MNRNELLVSLGFSNEYIKQLDNFDNKYGRGYGSLPEQTRPLSNDASSLIVSHPANDCTTKLFVCNK